MSRIYQQYLRSHLAQRLWALSAIVPLMFCSALLAQDKPVIKLKAPLNSEQALAAKADAARDISHKTEQAQLTKARQGDQELQLKAHKVLKQQQGNDWQTEQKRKAEHSVKMREIREQAYLEQAKKAARQAVKINPKSDQDPVVE
jgi:hypothetical protein